MAAASDLIVALATPAGESALGVVRLSGAGVLEAVKGFLKPTTRGEPADEAAEGAVRTPPLQPRRATVALVHDEARPIDQVVATFFPGPRSYTGEDLLELSAHGSPLVLADIVELACKAGARPAEPGEFTLRAYRNGRLDLAQAEAVGHLIRARTRMAARAAMAQLDGGLSRAVEAARRDIIGILADVEAALDHPEEDIEEFPKEDVRSRLEAARSALGRLAESHRRGQLALDGARVAIVGRPNVGKSSLLNALLGRERAIVAPEPGTTRDTLEETVDLDGVRATLVDTAGLRPEGEAGAVEREGIRRARRSLETADLALVVLDRSEALRDEDLRLLEEAGKEERPFLIALNKSDLPSLARLPDRFGQPVDVSALTESGVDQLRLGLRRSLCDGGSAADGMPLVLSVRHRRALEEARAALGRACEVLEEGELAAVHLREALAELGAIAGETAPEEVLREVFSRFCVGK